MTARRRMLTGFLAALEIAVLLTYADEIRAMERKVYVELWQHSPHPEWPIPDRFLPTK